jgi:hypothetical protein
MKNDKKRAFSIIEVIVASMVFAFAIGIIMRSVWALIPGKLDARAINFKADAWNCATHICMKGDSHNFDPNWRIFPYIPHILSDGTFKLHKFQTFDPKTDIAIYKIGESRDMGKLHCNTMEIYDERLLSSGTPGGANPGPFVKVQTFQFNR